jgi:hypothetical protein
VSAVPFLSRTADRLTHGAVIVVAFVLVFAIAIVGVVTGAASAKGEEPSALVPVAATVPVDMYTAMADIAAALATLPPPPPPTTVPARRVQTRPEVRVDPSDPGVWDALAHCETRGNWATDSVKGFSGGLGFAHGTWASNGGTEFAEVAADATREQQIEVAQRVLEGSGWGAWPGCSDLLGLR